MSYGLSYRETEPCVDLLRLSLFPVVTGATDGIGKSYAEEVSCPRGSPHVRTLHGERRDSWVRALARTHTSTYVEVTAADLVFHGSNLCLQILYG